MNQPLLAACWLILLLITSGCRPVEPEPTAHAFQGAAGTMGTSPATLTRPAISSTPTVRGELSPFLPQTGVDLPLEDHPPPTPIEIGEGDAPQNEEKPVIIPLRPAVLSRLQNQGTESPPSLSVNGTPQPTATAPPPATDPYRPVVELTGQNFGPAVAADLELDFAKIGFHVGPGGDANGLSLWMEALDAAGIPFFLKSVDSAGPLLEAQRLREKSGVPHVLVYRRAGGPYELPDYEKNPVLAARQHWELHRSAFPPELDPSIVWLETVNEVDKGRANWLGQFALETGRLALQDGYRWAAFGWSAGEPEMTDWTEPGMVAFLKLATANPDRLAIALHEYSYIKEELLREYPHFVGRFQQLYWICDQLELPRPTVLITEFGWEYRDVPEPADALPHLRQAAAVYAGYPQVKGAAIWYLGPGFGSIDLQTRRLFEPLTAYTVNHYFSRPLDKFIDPRLFD